MTSTRNIFYSPNPYSSDPNFTKLVVNTGIFVTISAQNLIIEGGLITDSIEAETIGAPVTFNSSVFLSGTYDLTTTKLISNTIESIALNDNINLSPKGSGKVLVNSDLDISGDITIAGNIQLNSIAVNLIESIALDDNIDMTPKGIGRVMINSDIDISGFVISRDVIYAKTIRVLDSVSDILITTDLIDEPYRRLIIDSIPDQNGIVINTNTSNSTQLVMVPNLDFSRQSLCQGVLLSSGSEYHPFIGAQIPQVSWGTLRISNQFGRTVIGSDNDSSDSLYTGFRTTLDGNTNFRDGTISVGGNTLCDNSRNLTVGNINGLSINANGRLVTRFAIAQTVHIIWTGLIQASGTGFFGDFVNSYTKTGVGQYTLNLSIFMWSFNAHFHKDIWGFFSWSPDGVDPNKFYLHVRDANGLDWDPPNDVYITGFGY